MEGASRFAGASVLCACEKEPRAECKPLTPPRAGLQSRKKSGVQESTPPEIPGINNCYAADLPRTFTLRFDFFSRLAVNSAETVFWSFSVSTR